MARNSSTDKVIDDVTECSICTEPFSDPRVLPCIHTLCLKCLMNYAKDRQPGDSMPCPLCRKDFTIPDDGLSEIQKNFVIEKLLYARKHPAVREAQRILCDVCSSDEASVDETGKPASKYCVQCQQNYCDRCSLYHRKMKSSSDHIQLDVGKTLESVELLSKIDAFRWLKREKHAREEAKVRRHGCKLDSKKLSDDLRKRVVNDIDKCLRKTEEVRTRLVREKNEFMNHFASIEDKINTAADKLIAAIECDREKLLSEVESIRLKRVKQLETVKQEVEQHMTALESFRRYKYNATMSLNSLHDRADELMAFDISSHVDNSLPPVKVAFTLSKLLDRDDRNLIGTVTCEGLSFQQYVFTLCFSLRTSLFNHHYHKLWVQHLLGVYHLNISGSMWFHFLSCAE